MLVPIEGNEGGGGSWEFLRFFRHGYSLVSFRLILFLPSIVSQVVRSSALPLYKFWFFTVLFTLRTRSEDLLRLCA